MVRVLFVTAPFKRAFSSRMVDHFSKGIETLLFTPAYPRTNAQVRTTMREKVQGLVLGDSGISKAIVEFRPQVIYTDSPLYAWHLTLQGILTDYSVPVIVHLRGDLWREFFSRLRFSSTRRKLLGWPVHFESMLGVASARKVTPICRWLEREVRRHFPSKPSEVVYQGVELSDFFPSRGIQLTHPAVAIIQNHTVYEKTSGLLRFAHVVEKLPNVHFYITTGEDVKQTFLPLVKSVFSRYKNVHFVPGIRHPEGVRKLLAGSDVYVLPSDLDCCPTTILEASLMHKPVIGSRVGGIPEIISEGFTGWTIPNDEPERWAERILTLLDDPSLAKRIGNQGRQWVAENFAWPKISAQVEKLIVNMAEG